MAILMQASNQWATRPDDQRFTSLLDLNDHCSTEHQRSSARVVPSRAITAVARAPRELQVVGPNGTPVNLTHWSFGQLAARVGAPAGYLRELPAPIASDALNYGLQTRDVEDLGVLLYQNGGSPVLRAVTGPNYGRIWNSTITEALVNHFGDGLNGEFRVPGEFGKRVAVTKENTTLYASDRDLFVFLADEERRIEMPDRRDGKPGSLARGFFVWNSEVGGGTLGVADFLFDYVCCNRIVWGATRIQELRVRHTKSAPYRWLEEIMPALHAYATSSTGGIEQLLLAARQQRIDNIEEFLMARFSRSQTGAIMAAHLADEQRPIETLWDAATGITAYARGVQYQDQRVALERLAGKVLDLAA